MRAAVALLLALAGCSVPATEALPVPPLAGLGNRAPGYNAIQGAAEAFSSSSALAGRPDLAAVAVSRLEWETVAVGADRSFFTFSTITPPALSAARWEVRRALGIAGDAPPPAVIAAMEAAAPALARGDRAAAAAALPPPLFAPDIIDRLSSMPYLPQANLATRKAQADLEFGRDEDREFP